MDATSGLRVQALRDTASGISFAKAGSLGPTGHPAAPELQCPRGDAAREEGGTATGKQEDLMQAALKLQKSIGGRSVVMGKRLS